MGLLVFVDHIDLRGAIGPGGFGTVFVVE